MAIQWVTDYCLPDQQREYTIPPMTVAIATLCENGKYAVMAADRFVGTADGAVAGDGPDCKISVVNNLLISFAGTPPDESLLTKLSKPDVNSCVDQIWTNVRMFLNGLRKKTCDGLGYDWQQVVLGVASPEMIAIRRKIEEVLPRTAFLISGKTENDEMAVFTLHEAPKNCTSPGFAAIGVGASLAQTVFARNLLTKTSPWPEAIYVAYEAKRVAEANSQVGPATDIAFCQAGQSPRFIEKETLAVLEEIYQKRQPPSLSKKELDKIRKVATLA